MCEECEECAIATTAPACPTTTTATTTTTTTCRTCIGDPVDMVVVVDVSPATFERHTLRHTDGKICLNKEALLLRHYTVAYVRQLLEAVAPRVNPFETGVRVAVVLFAARASVEIGFQTDPGALLKLFDGIDWNSVAADLALTATGVPAAARLHTPFKLMRETFLNAKSTEHVDLNFRRFAKPVLILTVTGGATAPMDELALATEVNALKRGGFTALPTVVGYADAVRADEFVRGRNALTFKDNLRDALVDSIRYRGVLRKYGKSAAFSLGGDLILSPDSYANDCAEGCDLSAMKQCLGPVLLSERTMHVLHDLEVVCDQTCGTTTTTTTTAAATTDAVTMTTPTIVNTTAEPCPVVMTTTTTTADCKDWLWLVWMLVCIVVLLLLVILGMLLAACGLCCIPGCCVRECEEECKGCEACEDCVGDCKHHAHHGQPQRRQCKRNKVVPANESPYSTPGKGYSDDITPFSPVKPSDNNPKGGARNPRHNHGGNATNDAPGQHDIGRTPLSTYSGHIDGTPSPYSAPPSPLTHTRNDTASPLPVYSHPASVRPVRVLSAPPNIRPRLVSAFDSPSNVSPKLSPFPGPSPRPQSYSGRTLSPLGVNPTGTQITIAPPALGSAWSTGAGYDSPVKSPGTQGPSNSSRRTAVSNRSMDSAWMPPMPRVVETRK